MPHSLLRLQQTISQINRALIYNDDARSDEMLCMIADKPELTQDGWLKVSINRLPCYEKFISNCTRARIYFHKKGVDYSVEAEGACEEEHGADQDKLYMKIKLRHVAIKSSAARTWSRTFSTYWQRLKYSWNSIWISHSHQQLNTSL